MILRQQTGLFKSILPKSPSDSGNVVFRISDNNPPRSVLVFKQIPSGVKNKSRDPRFADEELRRANRGGLMLINKSNINSSVVHGNNLYFPGQILEFTDVESERISDANSMLETTHDQHVIDPASIDLSDEQLNTITDSARESHAQLLMQLEALQKQQSQLKVTISSNQKIINECDRVLASIDTILNIDPENNSILSIKQQTEDKKDSAITAKQDAIDELNSISDLISNKQDEIRSLVVLIR